MPDIEYLLIYFGPLGFLGPFFFVSDFSFHSAALLFST